MSSNLVRWGGIGALVAGAMYIVQGIVVMLAPLKPVFTSFSDYLNALTFVIALLGTFVGILGLHALQRGREGYECLGAAGSYTALVGTAFMFMSALVSVLLGHQALLILFGVGLLAGLVGFVLLGATTLRARVLPPWSGVLFIAGFPISVAFAPFAGGILLGVIWGLVGYLLLSRGGI
jgi:hypothetical protein